MERGVLNASCGLSTNLAFVPGILMWCGAAAPRRGLTGHRRTGLLLRLPCHDRTARWPIDLWSIAGRRGPAPYLVVTSNAPRQHITGAGPKYRSFPDS